MALPNEFKSRTILTSTGEVLAFGFDASYVRVANLGSLTTKQFAQRVGVTTSGDALAFAFPASAIRLANRGADSVFVKFASTAIATSSADHELESSGKLEFAGLPTFSGLTLRNSTSTGANVVNVLALGRDGDAVYARFGSSAVPTTSDHEIEPGGEVVVRGLPMSFLGVRSSTSTANLINVLALGG